MPIFTIISGMLLFFASVSYAQDAGVTDSEIRIGTSAAFEGPAGDLGTNLRVGANVYFDKINQQGGIRGRKINLISYDDGYEPLLTLRNTRKLIEEDNIFLLFNYVGTPTSKAVVPVIKRAKIPYVTPFTGAEFLRNPFKRYVVNIRASYFDETEAIVHHLVDVIGLTRIAVFMQDDGYGAAGREGVARALKKRGLSIETVGKYTRNTTDIAPALKLLKASVPEAVIMIGAYKPCATLIRQAKEEAFTPFFANISFVGTDSFVSEVGHAGNGSIISQVVPHPRLSNLPFVQMYRKDMVEAGHKTFNFGSLEGYLNAFFLIDVLKRTPDPITREGFLDAVEDTHISLGGIFLSFGADDHQGLDHVYLTQIKDGAVEEFYGN